MKTELSSASVETLLHHPRLWRAGDLTADEPTISTGHAALDRLLAGGGWPCGGLIEVLSDRIGIGELRLLTPALAALSAQPRWILWLNPPHIPYAPALSALGIDVQKVLLVHPRQHRDALWALEQALRSGTCSAALAWLDERRLKNPEIRKLKLAASEGQTLAMLFRPTAASEHASMAELRIRLRSTAPESVEVDIVKRRGGWPVGLRVALPAPMPVAHAELQRHLCAWRSQHTADRSGCGLGFERGLLQNPRNRSRESVRPDRPNVRLV
jgi:hypothetical protein